MPTSGPFALQVTAEIEAVNPHNPIDCGAAILGSFTSPAGSSTDRSQMLCLDPSTVTWADDTQSAPANNLDGGAHLYELAVDDAGVATVTVDGVVRLNRASFMRNGTIAIGDQTNDPNVDGTMRVRSVTRSCP